MQKRRKTNQSLLSDRQQSIHYSNTEKWDKGAFTIINPNGTPAFLQDNAPTVNEVCWLATIVTTDNNGNYQCEHINELQWYDIFGSGYYYRYEIDYFPCLVTLLAMAVAIIFSAIKIIRILWELAIYRVLAMFFSLGDLHNGEKLKEIIKAIGGAFIVIIVNAVLLQFYLIFSAWLTAQKDIDGFTRIIMLIAVAIAVIDGPNLCQKLIGVDAGLRSAAATVGAMYAAGKMATGAGRTATKVGKEVGEFGRDVAHKSASVGGFVAGAGAGTVSNVVDRIKNPNPPKDIHKENKAEQKAEKQNMQTAKTNEQTIQDRNAEIHDMVRGDAPFIMKNNPDYTSDSVDTYAKAAGSIYKDKTPDELYDMAQDSYIANNGEQIIRDAAVHQDYSAYKAAKNKDIESEGSESKDTESKDSVLSNQDAVTMAMMDKHKDTKKVSSDGTYIGADLGMQKKITALQQSQAQKGNTVGSARREMYDKIDQQSKAYSTSDEYKNKTEVAAHTAAAEAIGEKSMSGKSLASVSDDEKKGFYEYQGNMSTAYAHRDEIRDHAKDYIKQRKEEGDESVTMDQAVNHVITNEQTYGMSYGFNKDYAEEMTAVVNEPQKRPDNDRSVNSRNRRQDDRVSEREKPDTNRQSSDRQSSDRNSKSRKINDNTSLNRSLGREKDKHNSPSTRQSAIGGYQKGRQFADKFRRKDPKDQK